MLLRRKEPRQKVEFHWKTNDDPRRTRVTFLTKPKSLGYHAANFATASLHRDKKRKRTGSPKTCSFLCCARLFVLSWIKLALLSCKIQQWNLWLDGLLPEVWTARYTVSRGTVASAITTLTQWATLRDVVFRNKVYRLAQLTPLLFQWHFTLRPRRVFNT